MKTKNKTEKAGHTKGPWTLTAGTGLVHRDGDFSLAGVIAKVQGRDLSSRDWRERQDANARLIAAAPDLLAFIKSKAAIFQGKAATGQDYADFLAAIAKAEGRKTECEKYDAHTRKINAAAARAGRE